MVKNPLARQETRVQPLGWEDPSEEDLATVQTVAKSQTRLSN